MMRFILFVYLVTTISFIIFNVLSYAVMLASVVS